MRIALIGAKGVGMAHLIAAERLGCEVVAVLDSDPIVGDLLRAPKWVNKWGPYCDEVVHCSHPSFHMDFETFKKVPADLLVISSPTRTHLQYLLDAAPYYWKILCEKPIHTGIEGLEGPVLRDNRIYVGHEWLCHPLFPYPLSPAEGDVLIRWGHEYPPSELHKAEAGVWWDLGIHCLAAMVRLEGDRSFTLLYKSVKKDYAYVVFQANGSRRYFITCAYRKVGDGEVVINGQILNWMDGLFELQLARVALGTHPANLEFADKTTELCERVVPYGGVS